jgi:hypothetical protein
MRSNRSNFLSHQLRRWGGPGRRGAREHGSGPHFRSERERGEARRRLPKRRSARPEPPHCLSRTRNRQTPLPALRLNRRKGPMLQQRRILLARLSFEGSLYSGSDEDSPMIATIGPRYPVSCSELHMGVMDGRATVTNARRRALRGRRACRRRTASFPASDCRRRSRTPG